MTPRKILVLARDFNETAMNKLKEDLTANGATIVHTFPRTGIQCEYAGKLDVLKKLPNVAGISPVVTYAPPRTF